MLVISPASTLNYREHTIDLYGPHFFLTSVLVYVSQGLAQNSNTGKVYRHKEGRSWVVVALIPEFGRQKQVDL